MAKPIGKTPVIEGEDAIAILKEMQEPPTKKDKEFAKKLEIKEQFYFNTLPKRRIFDYIINHIENQKRPTNKWFQKHEQ